MKSLPRHLIAVLCVLCLLSAQQGAFVHLLGHLGPLGLITGSQQTEKQTDIQSEDAVEHAAALTLTDVCASCLAFSALAAGASFSAPLTFARGPAPMAVLHRHAAPLFAALRTPYAARAPPLKL